MGDDFAEFKGYNNSLCTMGADVSGRTATRTETILDRGLTVGHGAQAGDSPSAVIVGTKHGTDATEVSRMLRKELGDMATNINGELRRVKVRESP
jgi:hypothetical protein